MPTWDCVQWWLASHICGCRMSWALLTWMQARQGAVDFDAPPRLHQQSSIHAAIVHSLLDTDAPHNLCHAVLQSRCVRPAASFDHAWLSKGTMVQNRNFSDPQQTRDSLETRCSPDWWSGLTMSVTFASICSRQQVMLCQHSGTGLCLRMPHRVSCHELAPLERMARRSRWPLCGVAGQVLGTVFQFPRLWLDTRRKDLVDLLVHGFGFAITASLRVVGSHLTAA